MKLFFRLVPSLVFFAMILAIMAVGIVQKDKTYSSAENRMLQEFPKLSVKRLLNGKFQKKYETYLSDQFPQRDLWVKFQTTAERVFGKKESNGVYFGKDGFLLEKYTKEEFDKKLVNKNVRALGKFVKRASKSAEVKVMMVPSKTYTLDNYLPAFAETYDEAIFYNQLEKELPESVLVPVCDMMQNHKKEYIYYKTDHHWTTFGAWYGYVSYLESCKKDGKIAEPKKDLEEVSDNFLGTTYSKVNIYSQKDKIYIYEPKHEMKVVYNLGEKTGKTFYEKKYLKKKDKYSVFLGGNHAYVKIKTQAGTGKKLHLIKDSYAHCLTPFLALHYDEIYLYDLRYFRYAFADYIKGGADEDVLILYNMASYLREGSIKDLQYK